MVKILAVFGTRPEAIKMAPVIRALSNKFDVKICVTAQHRQMLDQVLELFGITPDYDLDIMQPGQDLFDVTNNVLLGIKKVLQIEKPDIVLVHGDTTTTMVAALASYYKNIPVGHVEAGLRTNNIYSPFPEEANRQIVSRVASYHFVPTKKARKNLIIENIPDKDIFVTGNTVIDALLSVIDRVKSIKFPEEVLNELPFINGVDNVKIVLITGHRRESFGEKFEEICYALKELSEMHPDFNFVYPVHLNPNVREPVHRILSDVTNIYLVEPLEYVYFIKLMYVSYFIITDSGGVQEEAPSLGKPVLVVRDTTERSEAVDAGTVKLVGTSKNEIVKAADELIKDERVYKLMARSDNPYGDGDASKKIRDVLEVSIGV